MKKLQKEIYDSNNVLIMLSCIICCQEKDVSLFYKNKQRKCGYRAFCIDCNKQQKKEYYLKIEVTSGTATSFVYRVSILQDYNDSIETALNLF